MSGLVGGSSIQSKSVIPIEMHRNETHKIEKEYMSNANYVIAVNFISGAAAGAIAKTFIAPLDRTKINFQINSQPYSTRAALRFLLTSFQNEGFLSLYRGNSATMVRIIPYAAIQFGSHEQYKKILHVEDEGSSNARRFLAGSLAGITSQTFTYPLDLARARLAITDKTTGYRTLREVFFKVWREEGPRTLLRGFWATIIGVIPYAGTSFFTYGTLKRKHYEWTGDHRPSAAYSLIYGAIAGIIGQTTTYPLDIVRRRMQTASMLNTNEQYTTILSSLKNIYRTEGIIGGYYKGLSMNWIKGPLAVGISFTTFEFLREFLHKRVLDEK